MNDWLPPESAPKDGTVFIGDFGYPWPLQALWDPYDEHWNYCVANADLMANGKYNFYFETEYESNESLLRWMPMPKL
jgi:hypothetical protein